MDVYDEQFVWKVVVSGRLPGSLGFREGQYGRCCICGATWLSATAADQAT